MRRWVTIFLLVFMPLQLTWAAVDLYCHAESGSATQHADHQEHQHQADADQGDSIEPKAAGALKADASACHAGHTAAIIGSVYLTAFSAPTLSYLGYQVRLPWPPHLPLPERPNWTDLA